jgi:hypothetical protein
VLDDLAILQAEDVRYAACPSPPVPRDRLETLGARREGPADARDRVGCGDGSRVGYASHTAGCMGVGWGHEQRWCTSFVEPGVVRIR